MLDRRRPGCDTSSPAHNLHRPADSCFTSHALRFRILIASKGTRSAVLPCPVVDATTQKPDSDNLINPAPRPALLTRYSTTLWLPNHTRALSALRAPPLLRPCPHCALLFRFVVARSRPRSPSRPLAPALLAPAPAHFRATPSNVSQARLSMLRSLTRDGITSRAALICQPSCLGQQPEQASALTAITFNFLLFV